MDEQLSFLRNDFKQIVQQGGNVTHILYVKLSGQPSAEVGNNIRTAIFNLIANVHIKNIVNGQAISLTWRTTATASLAYYHCDAVLFNDFGVKEHTRILLRDVRNGLDAQFNNIFSNGTTGLAFVVFKPLAREVVLVDDDIFPWATTR